MVLTMTAGTAVIMWLGELITDRGVGNGMSILIFTQVVARFPTSLWSVGKSKGWWVFAVVIAIGLVIIAAVIFIEQAQRRIPVQYARRMVGPQDVRRLLDVHPAEGQPGRRHPGDLRVVAALPAGDGLPVQRRTPPPGGRCGSTTYFVRGDHPLYMITFFALIVFFTYFYVSITFNPEEVADNMKKYGGFIPGIRAGKPTEDYLSYVLSRITLPGSLYLGLIALIPLIAFVLIGADQNFPFGGTSILIMVGVALDTVKQIESQLQQRNYEGFLR